MSQIQRYYDQAADMILVEIHCGCCGLFFRASIGGPCFCNSCRNGDHKNCKVLDIMGIRG